LAEAVLAETTIGTAVARAQSALATAGCDTPRLDAELLLGEVLGVGRARLVLDRDQPLSPESQCRFAELIRRREVREPVAYILGRRDFRRLTLHVDRSVLIPRPETELLVEVGLGLPRGARVVDVGTGSGAVALALADERPDLVVRGLDLSEPALTVARGNARRLGLAVSFARADLLDDGRYDAVLANLPYVRHDASVAPEIADYEPPAALFAGEDGLDQIRRLVGRLGERGERNNPLPLVALEISPEQAPGVSGLLRAAGYRAVEVRPDLAGQARVVVGAP
jgi:release factor glutamine methyltransferase